MKKVQNSSISDPDVIKCPFPFYKELREDDPVYRDPKTGIYVVSKHRLIREVASDFETFSAQADQRRMRDNGVAEETDRIYAETGWPKVATIIYQDPPTHTHFRKLVDRVFTAGRIKKMDDYLVKLVDELIDRFADRGECDFIREFAIPLPIYVIADALGVPRSNIDKFKEWSDATVEPLGLMISREREIECAHLVVEFQHYFAAAAEERRIKRRDDIVSDLVHAHVDGERPLTTPELLSIIQQLLIAGNETTTNALASAMLTLTRQPELVPALRASPDRVKTFVEEMLRLESPIQGLFRRTTRDVTMEGTTIPAQSIVCMRFGAANRDEQQFDDAEAINLDRKGASSHLAFSTGNHFCVGAQLARAEMQRAIAAWVDRFDNICTPAGYEADYQPSIVFRALKSLPLLFDKR